MLLTEPRQRQRPATRLTPSLRQAITLLSLNGADLEAWLSVASAGATPRRAADAIAGQSAPRPPRAPQEGWRAIFDPDGLEAPPGSLIAHVLPQIAALRLGARAQAIALLLAEELEPTGWLGAPMARLTKISGAGEAEIAAVLGRLQGLEPAGIFARTLAECLALQARAAGELDEAMQALLEALPLLAEGGPQVVALRSGVPLARITEAAGILRGYDPKPGLAYAGFIPPPPPPDFRLERARRGWQILPGKGPALPEGFGEIGRALERRAGIGLALCEALVARQGAWLAGGVLAPLTSRELAEELGLHVATVNRALAALTLAGPRGTLPLRAMLARPVGPEAVSGEAVRARLAELLAAGEQSDRALAETLTAEGLGVARRTVSKYRRQLAEG